MDIEVLSAREHNLKNIDIRIPRRSFTVITGLSGSGKSSLAFDTLYAEGQRRYIDTFGSYARGFLAGGLERPNVDEIRGLGPVISIEQKTTNRNPRSTVGTITDIYDYFRLLFARIGIAYSWATGEKMIRYTEEEILAACKQEFSGQYVLVYAPVVRQRKGHYKDLFDRLRKKGYLTVRIDGVQQEIRHGMKLDRYKIHTIEVLIDKFKIDSHNNKRISDAIRLALKEGDGILSVAGKDGICERLYSRSLMDPVSGIAYNDPAPHDFSFNSPRGCCPRCKGLGQVSMPDISKIIPDRQLSIYTGGIAPFGKYRNSSIFRMLCALCEKYGLTLKTPISEFPEDLLEEVVNGSADDLIINNEALGGDSFIVRYDGIGSYLADEEDDGNTSGKMQQWADQFLRLDTCPECKGMRLTRQALQFRIAGKNIGEINKMDFRCLDAWIKDLPAYLSHSEKRIATEILKEIDSRIGFMLNLGLGYLSMDRSAATLSGGESQRIRLATQIGTRLVEALYILDEPSIGLHQRDNISLIHSLEDLRDIGNTVIVVEHDRDTMMHADYIIDMGPMAGRYGGEVVFSGSPEEMMKVQTLTADYLTGRKCIETPGERRVGNGKKLILHAAIGNNLKGEDIAFPLGNLICITGLSGSGKSTLINETLYPILSRHLYRSLREPLPYAALDGMEYVDKVVAVDQSPIGRSPRSNPATYTGLFTDIRNIFVSLPESRARGYKPGRFSFNVKGGRCEACKGNGFRSIAMNFLPDVLVPCETCGGKRYNRETLEVRYKGKSIADVLDMTINAAAEFFEAVPHIAAKLQVLREVGLGYVKLGQASSNLSGGESQRVKLAAELSRRDTGSSIYILDEPTTGLHFEDISVLLKILDRLVDRGNTVIVIEHNLDIIKSADYIIDMGPEGGTDGGYVVAKGTPEEIAAAGVGYTAPFLKEELERNRSGRILDKTTGLD